MRPSNSCSNLGRYANETHFKARGYQPSIDLLSAQILICSIRCLYNALNDRIRNLLLQYDYSKSTDPLQPLASHLVSLLTRDHPRTSDITVTTPTESFLLHKYILSARSPYFSSKLASAPDTSSWKIPPTIPPQSFGIALKHLYLGEIPRDLGGGPGTGFTDSEVLAGVDRISKHLEIQNLSQLILDSSDRRLARQRRQDEVERGRDQLESWFRDNVLRHAIETDITKADDVKWDRDNGIFADILLRADEDEDDDDEDEEGQANHGPSWDKSSTPHQSATAALGIPFDTSSSRNASRSASRSRSRSRHKARKSKIYPVHKAQLLRSEFFTAMFESSFREAQNTPHLQIINIDCSPQVLEIILTFLYTEKADFGLDVAVDVLFAADMLFLEKVKAKAAVVISTLANGNATGMSNGAGSTLPNGLDPKSTTAISSSEEELIDIYLILRAAWLTRVQRLEEFAARYIAYRLEAYIDDPEFAELVQESAGRISARQETDSIELLDDIRYYLSERFRLRFEDVGLDDAMDEEAAMHEALAATATTADGSAAAALAGQRPEQDPHAADLAPQSPSGPTTLPNWGSADGISPKAWNEGVDMTSSGPGSDPVTIAPDAESLLRSGAVRTLDGELAGDEFAADAVNYQILLGKIDALLERLKLDA